MLSVSMRLVVDPLANIAVSIDSFPYAIAMLDSFDPFSVVRVAVYPCIETFSTYATFLIVAQILITITELFVTFTMALVFQPFAFIYSTDLINTDTLAVPNLIKELSTVKRLFVTLYGKIWLLLELIIVKEVCDHLID